MHGDGKGYSPTIRLRPTYVYVSSTSNTRRRSGKAQTLSYQKEDFNRIFGPNGTGFSRAGRYGTNALYTWRTQTTPAADGEGGVEGTMKLYLMVGACVMGGRGW